MVTEREAGQILEGIKNLNARYGEQERRLTEVSTKVANLTTNFLSQPGLCTDSFKKTFATKEQVKPLEEVCNAVKRGAIYLLVSVVVSGVGVILYIKDQL